MKNEWRPNGKEDLNDGEALHHLLYRQGDIKFPRDWCYESTCLLLDNTIEEIKKLIEILKDKPAFERDISIVDYGVGSGFASIELIKKLSDNNLLLTIQNLKINFNLYLLDFPSGWFAKGYDLLKNYSFAKFISMRDPLTGKIVSLSELFNGNKIDIIIANMVLHLVPSKALPIMIHDFASVLQDRGILLWNSPDTPPTSPNSILIHDPNRLMRKVALSLIGDRNKLLSFFKTIPIESKNRNSHLVNHLADAITNLSPTKRMEAENIANKQILKEPHSANCIIENLSKYFEGSISSTFSRITQDDLLRLIHLPSNQKYLMEIEDSDARKQFTTLLMQSNVLTQFCRYKEHQVSYANLHWVSGKYRKKPKDPGTFSQSVPLHN